MQIIAVEGHLWEAVLASAGGLHFSFALVGLGVGLSGAAMWAIEMFKHSFLLSDDGHPLFLSFFVEFSQPLVVISFERVLFFFEYALSLKHVESVFEHIVFFDQLGFKIIFLHEMLSETM
jgi:sensor histidine kinase YesM